MFTVSFAALCIVCAVLYILSRSSAKSGTEDPAFLQFQRTYLAVYFLAAAGDWLQGPHVYALYQSYGMTKHQIEILFIAGFGSSMICGTFVGSVADKFGRRLNCIIYGVLYGAACVTKHFNSFWILMIGRLCGGIATSILFSAFESWLVYEHVDRKFNSDLLSSTFSVATLGNSVVAIVSGLAAQFLADSFGFVAPFDASLCILAVMTVVIVRTWTENYGDASAHVSASFVHGWHALCKDRKMICLGLIQSLFEGSMYVFVLEWTPALDTAVGAASSVPHGHVFASFMVAVMIGSSIFKMLSQWIPIESFMRVAFLVAAVCLLLPIWFPHSAVVVFSAFVAFEVVVGMFWPAMGTMRSKYVPEEFRATIMNFFRIPLNLMVVMILMMDLNINIIFGCCGTFLLLAFLMQSLLYTLTKSTSLSVAATAQRKEKLSDTDTDAL